MVSTLYYNGEGSIPKDMAKAYKWLYISSSKGNPIATQGIEVLKYKLSKSDIAKGKKKLKPG